MPGVEERSIIAIYCTLVVNINLNSNSNKPIYFLSRGTEPGPAVGVSSDGLAAGGS